MQEYRKNLGKVSLTAEGAWTKDKSFNILSIVYDEHTLHGFISKQYVPEGVDLYNKEYWMPFNVSGYSDNNIIILSEKTSETSIKAYTLEEAINSVAVVGRRPGMILGFYNENTDRLDIGGRWEIWQFNSTTISEWEDIAHWQNIYYSFNKFVGWYRDVESLKKYNPFPEIGCYAYVGTEFNEATIYRCDTKFIWTDTTQHAWDYIKVVVQGNVTIGENGNWFNNGVDTGIPASIKGENGKTPVFRQYDNTIQYSFDNVNWITISDKVAAWFRWNATTGDTQANNVGRIQISRDNVTWTNLSGDIINKLHISRYIGAYESLPTSGIAEGTIYAKGPTYNENDASHANPIYRLWVYAWKGNTLAWQDNGEFTSIAAGVVQETGNSETEVMSQKATTEKLTELASYVENPEWARVYTDAEGRVIWGIKQDGSIEWSKGIPTPIRKYVELLDLENDEEIERINQLVIGLTDTFHYETNPEWAHTIVDAEGRIVMGIKQDGSFYFPNREMYHVESNPEWAQVTLDNEGRIIEGIKNDGKKYFPKQEMLEKWNDPEGRTEMTLDDEGKIVSYRDSDGVKHELKMKLYDVQFSESSKEQIKDIVGAEDLKNIQNTNFHCPKYGTVNIKKETFYLTYNIAYSDKTGVVLIQDLDDTDANAKNAKTIAHYYIKSTLNVNDDGTYDRESIDSNSIKLDFYAASQVTNVDGQYYVESSLSDGTPTSSSIRVTQIIDVPPYQAWSVNKSTEHYCIVDADFGHYLNRENIPVGVKYQGSSTLYNRKRNFRFTFYKDSTYSKKDKIKIGEMVRLSGYNLKANWSDNSRIKEMILYASILEVWNKRPITDRFPWDKEFGYNTGATGFIKMFPISTYIGGVFYGIHTFGLKKDERNYMLDGDDSSGIFVCGERRDDKNWTTSRAENWTDEMMDEMSKETANALNTFFDFINNRIEDEEFNKANIPNRMDVQGWIDYFICMQTFLMWDSICRNMILHSRSDKKKFYPYFYDLDLSLNHAYNADIFDIAYDTINGETRWNDMSLWANIRDLYWDEIVNRYCELRDNVLNIEHIRSVFKELTSSIPLTDYFQENKKWGKNTSLNSFEPILEKIDKRLVWLDNNYFIV